MHTDDNQRFELLRYETTTEMRAITLAVDDERIRIRERTDGEFTLMLFDCLWRECTVALGTERMADLLAALGKAGTSDLAAALRSFFGSDGFLGDLQDLLDREGIPYEYHVQDGTHIAVRR